MLVLCTNLAFSQTPYYPANYYNTATGTGYTLKTQLYNIIKTTISSGGYAGLYTTYALSDVDNFYENDGTVLDMYSENPAGTDPYNYSPTNTSDRCGNYAVEGDCYNREHIIPQYFFNSATPMVSDAHSVTPTDGKVNGLRNNYPHGKVGATATSTTLNGSKLGNALNSGYAAGYTGIVFEPVDDFKGDIARIYFYFATRYENVIASWGNTYPMFNNTTNQVFTDAFKNILLTWNTQDPVSPREIARNNGISATQHNRNPYIDHPEYVSMVWGSPLATNQFDISATVSIFPNPTNDNKINIETETALTEIDLISVNGQIIQQIKNPISQNKVYILENLPIGFYFLKLESNNQTTTKKVIVN